MESTNKAKATCSPVLRHVAIPLTGLVDGRVQTLQASDPKLSELLSTRAGTMPK